MTRAACHCGAVRLIVEPAPTSVTDCNCSICRRYGALWAYTGAILPSSPVSARIVQGEADLEAYVWGQREYGLQRCRKCGCVTHVSPREAPATVYAANARLFVDFDPAGVTLVRWDNAETGRFWTRPDAPIRKGMHPPMAPPGPDDWL